MTLRIAIGGFLHESHSFAPLPTTYANFLQPGGFPPLCHGPALLPALRAMLGGARFQGLHDAVENLDFKRGAEMLREVPREEFVGTAA